MAQILVTVDSGQPLGDIRKAIKMLRGVVSTTVVKESAQTSIMKEAEEVPNATTLAAMREVESGQDAGAVCVDDFESFMASMEQ